MDRTATLRDQDSDIWIWDFARQTLTRLTFDPAVDMQPVWTPDSRRILFASQRNGPANLFSRAADGTGADQRLTTGPNAQFPDSVAPDGGHVLAHGFLGSGNKFDVMQVPFDSASKPSSTSSTPTSRLTDAISLTSRTNQVLTRSTCVRIPT